MARGRKAAPIDEHGRKRHTLPPGEPEMPAHIRADPMARAEWRRVCDDLRELGLLSPAVRIAIEVYVAAYVQYRSSERATDRQEGERTVKWFCTEFGLTPVSARKLGTKAPPKDDGKLRLLDSA